MAVQDIPLNSGLSRLGFRYTALSTDTLPTTAGVNLGDKAAVLGGTNKIYNGSTWEEDTSDDAGNLSGTALASAARTASSNSGDIINYNGRSIHVVLDMTVVGTGSVTLTIEGKDPLSGKYYTLLAGAAVVTNVTNVYKVGPGLPATANVSANDILPRTFRISVTANNANSATYSVGYSIGI